MGMRMIEYHDAMVRVRYAETDQMGVAYHANYLVWFEVGRVELMRALGFEYKRMESEDDCRIVVADAQSSSDSMMRQSSSDSMRLYSKPSAWSLKTTAASWWLTRTAGIIIRQCTTKFCASGRASRSRGTASSSFPTRSFATPTEKSWRTERRHM